MDVHLFLLCSILETAPYFISITCFHTVCSLTSPNEKKKKHAMTTTQIYTPPILYHKIETQINRNLTKSFLMEQQHPYCQVSLMLALQTWNLYSADKAAVFSSYQFCRSFLSWFTAVWLCASFHSF